MHKDTNSVKGTSFNTCRKIGNTFLPLKISLYLYDGQNDWSHYSTNTCGMLMPMCVSIVAPRVMTGH